MTKNSVSPRFGTYKAFMALTLMVMFIVTCVSISFAADNEDIEVVAERAGWNLRIAEKQYDRGLYKEAEMTLVQIKPYVSKLSLANQGKFNSLNDKIHSALGQRRDVLATLKLADDLSAQGQYSQAIEELNSIRNSKALTDAEKQYVDSNIASLRAQSQVISTGQTYTVPTAPTTQSSGDIQIIDVIDLDDSSNNQTSNVVVYDTPAVNVTTPPATNQPGIIIIPLDDEAEPVSVTDTSSVQVEIPSMDAPSAPVINSGITVPQESLQDIPDSEKTYIDVVQQQRNRQISYTKAIVDDAVNKAQSSLSENEFADAKQSIAKAMSVVNKNKLLLGDQLYGQYETQLNDLTEQVTVKENEYADQQEEAARIETEQLQKQIRETVQRQKAEAIQGYLEGAYAFQKQQRYTEALGQLEQILVLDPNHDEALRLKSILEDTVRWRKQIEQIKDSNDKELELLLQADEKAIPYSDDINFPRDWKEIAARRKADQEAEKDPMDIAVYKSLEQIVNLSELTEDTPLDEAIEIISNSVEPPLPIFVDWNNLSENAFIDKRDPIGVTGRGLTAIQLKTGLDRVLRSVGDELTEVGFVVSEGIITVATEESLPINMITKVYDVREIVSSQTNSGYGGSSGGMGGSSMGGSSMGGMGGGSSMGGMGGGSSMGGMGGGSSMGGSSMGGSSMGGSSMGGGTNYQTYRKLYQLMENIVQIDKSTWDEDTRDYVDDDSSSSSSSYDDELYYGEGSMRPFGEAALIVTQTPEMHDKISDFIEKMRFLNDDQVSIETRFIVVDENFLEDIGVDVTINSLKIAGFNLAQTLGDQSNITQGSYEATATRATSISSSLGGSGNSSLNMGFGFGGEMDDLSVDFLIRATEAHANAKTLTAPKVTVINGENAYINVTTEINYISDVEFESDTSTGGTTSSTNASFTNEIETITSGIRMNVTPTVTADKKYVILSINTYLTDVDLDGLQGETTGVIGGETVTKNFYLPKQQITTINTRVTVPDMGTILLGGLTLTAEREVEYGVPILGKIPIVQRLFSNRSDVKDKQILLILVKPTIILKGESEEDAIAALSS